MIDQEQVKSLIRRAAVAIDQGAPVDFAAALQELEGHGWDNSAFDITEIAFIAVDFLPRPVDADAAAGLTERAVQRFRGSLNILAPVMEAVIRGSAGDHEAIRGVPRDRALTHSLVVVGQIVHEGHGTIDEMLAELSTEEERNAGPS